MLNAEKYRDEILKIVVDSHDFSMNKHNYEIKKCHANNCSDCLFNIHGGGCSCSCAAIEWLLSEYKETVKLSRLEYELLRFWNNKEYKYIARDSNNAVFVYREKPSKNSKVWGSLYEHRVVKEFDKLFQFVQWSDEQPTSIKEVLENCEVVDDDL